MKSLQSKIILILLSISLLPLLIVTAYTCQIAGGAIRDKVNTASQSTLSTISHSIDSELYRLLNEMDIATSSREFQEIMNGLRNAATDGETWVLLRRLDSLMLGILGKSASVGGIYLTLPDGNSYAVADEYRADLTALPKQDWFQSTENNSGTLKHCGMNPLGREQKQAIIYGKVLRDTSAVGNLQHIGSIHFALNPQLFTALSAQGDQEGLGTFWLFDTQDRIISEQNEFSTSAEVLYRQYRDEIMETKSGNRVVRVNGEPMMMLYEVSSMYRYRVLYLIPNSIYISEIAKITWITVIFAAGCAVVVVILSILVSRSISKPILELNRAMKRTEKGNFDVSLQVKSRDEIGQVVHGFNKMVVRLKRVFTQSIEQEKKKKELEISALQYQINPHFLYNLLASIRSLALVEGAIETGEMLSTAAKLMKSTIGRAGTMIPLEQEMENIERFLYIQNLCHNGAILWQIDLPKEYGNCQIPNLVLQPIVENSVFYGITPDTGRVSLTIGAKREEDALVLTVTDNGPGIEKEKLEQIFSARTEGNHLTHMGLQNTDERIRLNFGPEYGISITSGAGGTKVRLRLPYRPKEEQKWEEFPPAKEAE